MKKRFKKITSLIVIIATLACIMPINAFAGNVTDELSGRIFNYDSDVTLELVGDEFTVIRAGRMRAGIVDYKENIIIPSSVDGIKVTSIDEYAFFGCTELKTVEIPNTITNIGEGAFYACNHLTSVTIPDSVTNIGQLAFCGCYDLSKITTPFLGKSIDSTGTESRLRYWFLGETDADFPNLKEVTITKATRLEGYSFKGFDFIESITLPNTLKDIEAYAFDGCTSLKSIAIPDSVTNMADMTFAKCSSLENVTIGKGLTEISAGAFRDCKKLKRVTFSNKIKSIGDEAFWDCEALKSITIPDSVTSIGSSAFDGCESLTTVKIPSGVTEIGSGAFDYCRGLTSIVVDDNNKVYDSRNNCNAIIETSSNKLRFGCRNTKIPDSVTIISNRAFAGQSYLTNIVIPSSVTCIWDFAFSGCRNLTNITLPKNLKSLGLNAFYNCTGLTDVTFLGNTKFDYGDDTKPFLGCSNLKNVYLLKDSYVDLNYFTTANFPNIQKYYLDEKEETVTKYTIKFVNEDGTVLQSSELECGATPVYKGKTPTKSSTDEYTYTFAGWNKAISKVTGDTTYEAIYNKVIKDDESNKDLKKDTSSHETTSVYRLYNAGLGVHHYTNDVKEKDNLVAKWGWSDEGTVFTAYTDGGDDTIAVYRLYNPGLSQHLLTSDTSEVKNLTSKWGWNLENNGNPCFYLPKDSASSVAIYRLYNPYLSGGEHLYTTDKAEYDRLPKYDWNQEGVVFNGVKAL